MARVIILLFLLSLYSVSSDKCYTLSMEGGGLKGPYEAGAMMALTQYLPPAEVRYNVMGGISIGSYNTCWCSGFSIGDERNMAIHLQNVWLSITKTSMMFNFRPFFWALFWAPSIVDNSPAFNLIVENSGDQIRRNVSVGTTDVSTGELINYNETIGPEYLPTACFASGAYPGAFPPVPFMDSYYIDGCATANMNAFIVINRCKEMGYQDEDIVVDLFYDEPPEVLAKDKVNTTKQAIGKIDNIREYFKDEWFISQIKYDFPDVTFRYVVSPSQPLDNSPIVKPGGYQYKIDLGYNDTVKLIKMTQAERDLQLKRRYSINPHFS